jgi:flagella basal body P-ring formation protein FlgA
MNIPFVRPRLLPWLATTRSWLALAWPMLGALFAATAPVLAQAAPEVPPATLARALALAAEAAQALAPREARISVEAGQLDARLTLAPCARIEPYLPSGVPTWGRSRVGLRCTDGAARWNVFLPVTVQVWAMAPLLASALPAGARLSEGQLARGEVDWAAAATPPMGSAENLAGRTLARAMAAGQPLHASDLQPRLWFATGDSVRIEATGAGFSIIGEGQALTPGMEGLPARVRTESGRVLVARPVGDRRVEVSL